MNYLKESYALCVAVGFIFGICSGLSMNSNNAAISDESIKTFIDDMPPHVKFMYLHMSLNGKKNLSSKDLEILITAYEKSKGDEQ